jgi:tetratricopeptide (TPR) repeat protein
MSEPAEPKGSPSRPERPDTVAALLERAVRLHQGRKLDEARAIYEQVLRLQPRNFDALHLLGTLLAQTGHRHEAVDLIERAIAVDGRNATAYYNLGNVLRDLKRTEEAIARYDKALALNPNASDAHCNRGNSLLDLGRPAEALGSFEAALRIRPDYIRALVNAAAALIDLRRPEEAIAHCDRVLALEPNQATALNNRGYALRQMRRSALALENYDRAIALRPDYAEAHCNRGNALLDLGQPGRAIECYDRAVALKPDYGDAHWNKSAAALQMGDFATGWRLYEWRKRRRNPVGRCPVAGPEWTGRESISGKTLLVYFEQGFGDTIQFSRYARLLEARGARVVFFVPSRLKRLLRSLSPTIALVEPSNVVPRFDYQVALLSLPFVLSTVDEAAIPSTVPYLSAEPDRIDAWRRRLGERGFRIGIAWQGNPEAETDAGRSMPLASLAPLCDLPGVRLISLQKEHGLDQLPGLPEGMTVETLDGGFDEGPDGFVDTAAIMMSLDLVVTSDTSIAHLAGALGRPVWVALQHHPEWRWMLGRPDSPWYPTMRLFRQGSPDDWAGVLSVMKQALTGLLPSAIGRPPGPAAPQVTVSWGELIDKITILQIKSGRLSDAAALANVRSELAHLEEIARTVVEGDPALRTLQGELRSVNEHLWDIEEGLRRLERQADFGPGFVELARSVYRTNDRRARLKRQINQATGSVFQEEKSYGL